MQHWNNGPVRVHCVIDIYIYRVSHNFGNYFAINVTIIKCNRFAGMLVFSYITHILLK